jgi:oxepin-CoA hydrolase/3-oxo-5,6-dehydrosuberyl-CoA semialdehyde dehydrogenase
MQRCAVQGSPTTLTEITQVYQPGGQYKEPSKHPFRLHFEELVVGDTLITHKRTITETDIVNFANVSGITLRPYRRDELRRNNLYRTCCSWILRIVGLPAYSLIRAKRPVLLNYGLEECRFLKPVYAGMTIGVKLTVKEKVNQEKSRKKM